MLGYIAFRLISTVPVVGVVVVVIFLLLHLAPGDPAALIAGEGASIAQIEQVRGRLHLNEPLHVQFGIWVARVAAFDLGQSAFSELPVSRLIAQRIEPTLMLAATTMIVTVLIAIPLGVLAASRARTSVDRGVIMLSIAGFSVPVFVIGYALIYVFAIKLRWLPVQGYKPLADGLLTCLRHLILPSVALAFVFSALIARVTRAAMLDILDEDYIRTARAKGARTPRVLLLHALKNAGAPVMTVIGIGCAALIGGVVVTESVFNIPGMGRLTIDAILHRDYPVVQGVMLTFSIALIIINLLVDLSYALFDPRIRY
jgi:peptide/nickel transport system permease protein